MCPYFASLTDSQAKLRGVHQAVVAMRAGADLRECHFFGAVLSRTWRWHGQRSGLHNHHAILSECSLQEAQALFTCVEYR
jgi:hypothetical protein